jgi:MHS family proline/betaine transporter-like MFS transporter
MSLFSSLRRDQKEAIGLLQIGTFLEYFDLMLYVHMAVLLNDLFFPKTDPHTAALLSAFAFCSTFVLRPFGALLFGYIGDHIGRKTTVIITTMMMAVSCLIMANLPTYSQIGITAAWIVTLCRIMQGLSSLGEIIGAEIYLTEITKPPVQYPAVGLIWCFSSFGSMMALAVAFLVTSSGFDWRLAFWIGACIALVGSIARTRLRETPEFVDMKRRIKKSIEESTHDGLAKASELLMSTNIIWKEKVNKATALAYFLTACAWPVCFYFSFVWCGDLLKNKFGFTGEQVIRQNFFVSITQLISFIIFVLLSYKINPIKILKFKFWIFFPVLLFIPLLINMSDAFGIFLIQCFTISFATVGVPANSIFLKYFPVYLRFTYTSFMYALSRAVIYVITSFSLVYLIEGLGYWGLLVVMIPTTLAFLWGVHHFESLEKEFGDKPPAPQHPDFFKLD